MPSSIPPCLAPNEHQSKAHFYSGTDHQLYTRKAMQLKASYFWTGKYFLCHCLVEENVLEKKKSKQEEAACRKESQACNQWLGHFSGQGDIPTAVWSSSLNCQTLMFVNWRPTFPGRLLQQRSGWLEFLETRGMGASQSGHSSTRTDKASCVDCLLSEPCGHD